MKLSVIVLAMTTTEELFEMTSNCVSSLIVSESSIEMEIIVVESNKNYLNSGFAYPDFVKVIIPESEFNFHKFLNIGIKASTGEYVALCNNDLVFYTNWFSKILKIKEANPSIQSFSPSGIIENFDFVNEFELGYKVRTHIMGWCIVVNKKVFDKIGLLDETFDLYYADNDYAMTLKRNNIKHAVVMSSKVEHLGKRTSQKCNLNVHNRQNSYLGKYKIPSYLYNKDYEWVLENEINLSGFLKYHNKWGAPNVLYKKNKLADYFLNYRLGYLNRFIL